jgi:hypothetical protein
MTHDILATNRSFRGQEVSELIKPTGNPLPPSRSIGFAPRTDWQCFDESKNVTTS